MWNYRDELINSIDKVFINPNDDFLKESEIVNFWNKMIQFINKMNKVNNKNFQRLNENNNTLWMVKNELRKYSWANSMLNRNSTSDIYWEDKFASDLRSLWIIWSFNWFKIFKLRGILTQDDSKENNKK